MLWRFCQNRSQMTSPSCNRDKARFCVARDGVPSSTACHMSSRGAFTSALKSCKRRNRLVVFSYGLAVAASKRRSYTALQAIDVGGNRGNAPPGNVGSTHPIIPTISHRQRGPSTRIAARDHSQDRVQFSNLTPRCCGFTPISIP